MSPGLACRGGVPSSAEQERATDGQYMIVPLISNLLVHAVHGMQACRPGMQFLAACGMHMQQGTHIACEHTCV